MNLPLVPLVTILLVFGAPYLIIFLQGRRLNAVESEMRRVAIALTSLEDTVRNGRNLNA